jgi:hypothetical protein
MNAMLNNETFVRPVNNGAPFKSTTHEERYYHIGNDGTVFFRRESDGKWYASIALCDARDQFVRRVGRCVARRKYFAQPHKRFAVNEVSYEVADKLWCESYRLHLQSRFGKFAKRRIFS